MAHWLRKVLPSNELADTIAGKIEDADERIENLKEQILAVQARRAELEEEARTIAADSVDEPTLEHAVSSGESQVLAACQASATILLGEIRRLFVEASPFLSELAQHEMEKAQSIHDNMERWASRV
ncbi:hypothetical protein ACSVIJ_05195 [Pseudomonas sp. NCHU5208]|uniref:hypothetical protein n=1 Tax=unclassified Pseudomonas TaxID=196821 RepID=UPI003F97BD6F